jgi:lysophospholipase L1-like esterase
MHDKTMMKYSFFDRFLLLPDYLVLARSILLIMLFIIFNCNSYGYTGNESSIKTAGKWVGTWSTAPQLVETNNNPPFPGLSNNTLRQIVHVSIGGDSLRMRFTNEFSNSPVTLNSVHIAVSKGNGIIDTLTEKVLYFNGKQDITIERGSAVMSDPFQFTLQPLSDVVITIYFGNTSPDVTGHPGSRTTSYIHTGNQVSKADFSGAVKTDHWYIINTIEVLAPESAYAVAILGNSITDGRGSGTNKQNRWPDELSRRFQANPETKQVAVLNEGIGGNCVLRACLGPSAVNRFERDVLNQNGVKWLIILEGVNDIGGAFGSQGSDKVAQDLITAYGQMIDKAHAKGILVYGATILPFSGNSYYSVDHERARTTVNEWIRNSGRFDAVIDLEKAVRDPNNPLQFLSTYDTGDHLHPNEAGHHAMAEAVDLSLFVVPDTSYHGINIEKSEIEKYFSVGQKWTKFSSHNPQTSMDIGSAGNSKQTWLWPNIIYEDTTLVTGINPSATPLAADFPNATHSKKSSGVYYDDITKAEIKYDLYEFFQFTETSVVMLGSGVYLPGTNELKNIQHNNLLYLKFPIKYGDKYIASKDTIAPRVNLFQVETITKTIDAFGTITFGNDSFDALRQKTEDKTEIIEYGLVASTYTKRFYDWYTKSNGIAELDADTSSLNSGIVPAYNLSLTLFGELFTGVKVNSTDKLLAFLLSQNYPNPFNPTTTISYQLSMKSIVTLKLFDVLGKEVATLVNEQQNPGIHHYTLSIMNYKLSSGVYYYKLTAGDFSQTKKMTFLK